MKVKIELLMSTPVQIHIIGMIVCFRSSNLRTMMGVVVVGSPKEGGMLNRSPGTREGGGHLLIVVIYISSYQSTVIPLLFQPINSQ